MKIIKMGRDNMTKSKKKKNYKLRRRVKRTIASVIMVMAVVVAAIPVENLGTMQAASANAESVDLRYTDDMGDTAAYPQIYAEDDYEDDFSDTYSVSVERVDDGAFTDLFIAYKRNDGGNNAMVKESTLSNSVTSLDIGEQEYYDYVQLSSEYIGAVTDTYKDTELSLEFGDDTTSSYNAATASIGSNTYSLDAITLKKLKATPNSRTFTTSPSLTGSYSEAQGYTNYDVNLSVEELYHECWLTKYNNQISAIETYNRNIDEALNTLTGIQTRVNAGTATIADVDRWQEIAASVSSGSLNEEYTGAKTLSNRINAFPTADNGLNSVVDYIIRNCCYATTSNTLKNYSLVKLNTSDGYDVYVPQVNAGANKVGTQNLDDDGYLVSGYVNIIGIASNAFNGTYLQDLTIPSTVKFIGASAFENSKLRRVDIDVTSCAIIGAKAFADSASLATLTFSGPDSVLETIDKQAFANTVLTSVTIPGSVTQIGAGAFAEAPSLHDVTFSDNGRAYDLEIGAYAFYDCYGLGQINFPESSKQYQIEKAAFAVASGRTTSGLGAFAFPANNTAINYGGSESDEGQYDYILANRTGLLTVTFPERLTGN